MRIARVEAVGDAAAGLNKYDTLTSDRPLAYEGPVVERQARLPTCPVLTPEALPPGDSCVAVVGLRPSEFFAGEKQFATLLATATDPSTGANLDSVLINFVKEEEGCRENNRSRLASRELVLVAYWPGWWNDPNGWGPGVRGAATGTPGRLRASERSQGGPQITATPQLRLLYRPNSVATS
jgi:hypothetical protein